jgi:hypothetical protein
VIIVTPDALQAPVQDAPSVAIDKTTAGGARLYACFLAEVLIGGLARQL